MTYSTLSYDVADRIGTMRFETPATLNSLTEQRFAEIEAVLDAVEADGELGAFIVTAIGKAFCVGLDLDLLDRAFADLAYFETVVRRVAAIVERIEALDIPTIAAINGYARAGGFEIAMACDFVIVADEAHFGDAHTDSGVVPACVSLRVARKVGMQRAKEVLWTARYYNGPEAVAAGLAIKSAPLADLDATARAFAGTMTDKPRATLAHLKRLLREGADLDPKAATEFELQAFVRYMSSQPYGREGYRAFREKRVPDWKA